MSALVLLVWSRPGWFGVRPPEPAATGVPTQPGVTLLPRVTVDRADRPLGVRTVTDRVPSKPSFAEVLFADALPSVVHVTTLTMDGEDVPTAAEPLESESLEHVSGTGSGLVWDDEGHIVTCLHVVDGSNGATVTLANNTKWSAKLVGFDEAHDLAVVRIAAPREMLTPIRVGRSSDLRVGMTVLSVASPYGLGHSLSVGYVSGLGRRIRSTSGTILDAAIQTDAAIHPGSSGGALIDDQGRVVGLNAAIHADSRRATGVGFALPIDQLVERVPRVIEAGYRWYPHFGLLVCSDAYSLEILGGAPAGIGAPQGGVVVAQVDADTPAARAGIQGLKRLPLPSGQAPLVVNEIIVGVGPIDPNDGHEGPGSPGEEGVGIASPAFVRADLDRAVAALGPDEPLLVRVAGRDGVTVIPLVRGVGPRRDTDTGTPVR